MFVGYMRVSKADGSQNLTLQRDALIEAEVSAGRIFEDKVTGSKADRPGLTQCLEYLRAGDVLVVWKLDRLGRSLQHLCAVADDLQAREVDLLVLSGYGKVDTSTATGRLMFTMIAAFAEFEREMNRERSVAGLAVANAAGRFGGRKHTLNKAQVLTLQKMMTKRDIPISEICADFKVSKQTLYKYVSAEGELRERALSVLEGRQKKASKK